ncbi:immunity 22 family protein [Flavonifractor plautii]|uniref:immunity 22 family protein n=1 Tax=Bacillota TaxID=1239 RepID=UPI0034C38577
MRQIEQLDISYTTRENRCSVFVGVCKSQELFEQYWEKDYDLLHNEYIGFEMGVDFGINTYDEDFAIMILQKNLTTKIDELVEDAEIFDIDALKRLYPDGLDRPYNAIIVLDRVSYDGSIQEVQNETFGYFKFLGVFDSLQ